MRSILARRAIVVTPVLWSMCFGCSRHKAEQIAFDALLSSNRIDRIVIRGEDAKESSTTNVFTGEQAQALLNSFQPTNRLVNSVHGKSEVSGKIVFFSGNRFLGGLSYFRREDVFSYEGYEFGLRGTNFMHALVHPPRIR